MQQFSVLKVPCAHVLYKCLLFVIIPSEPEINVCDAFNDCSRINSEHVNTCYIQCESIKTRMCANAQPDGRPAERSLRPLFNAAKSG